MKNDFENFKISKNILTAINELGYKTPTSVQKKVIPEILKDNDIIVKSETGSGKTASFAIPLCEKINWDIRTPQVLILSPTRELAVQIREDIFNIGRFKRIKSVAVFGKQPFSEQVRDLKQKTHIVVGTPGRVLDHIERKTIDLEEIKYLVIDEADEMLNMGFIDQVKSIIESIHKDRVTLLFSATISEEIDSLCKEYMKDPININIEVEHKLQEKIDQKVYKVDRKDKLEDLNKVLIKEIPETAVIFCNTKENVDNVSIYLREKGYSRRKIHGGMMQKERLEVMNDFKNGEFRFLVATDVAARGIDVEGITHIINFDIPMEREAYVHRIGRTARAGKKGKAITFVCKYEERFLESIEEFIGFNIQVDELPSHSEIEGKKVEALKILKNKPAMKKQKSKLINENITKIYLNGGKNKKIRPGDIVGAITQIDGIMAEDIGIIDVQDTISYVDILNGKGDQVIKALKNMTIKGKKLRVEKAKK